MSENTKAEPTITVTVPLTIPEQRLRDQVCNGMESGSYGSFEIQGYEPKGIENHPDCEYPHIDVPFLTGENEEGASVPGAVLLKDKYGDEPTVYRLTRDSLIKGLTLMAHDNPYQFRQAIEECGGDVITGDLLIQYAVLGKHVYC
jgi:hypothetical protein